MPPHDLCPCCRQLLLAWLAVVQGYIVLGGHRPLVQVAYTRHLQPCNLLLTPANKCFESVSPDHVMLDGLIPAAGNWYWRGWRWCKTMPCLAVMAPWYRQPTPLACCSLWISSPPPPSLPAWSPTCKPVGQLPSGPLLPYCPKPLVGSCKL